ncbi:hypothetical protein POM88_047554 [Heracleum sosnowskyi]|uniref:Uncharacterized protein n=1 Tax=Heracleum sosnowskyi TaxID=360622 RepID=A0AAD8GUK4_9APIA|nr:hypothetical protein POM88_047554 [Heracleum sosnowskyi]
MLLAHNVDSDIETEELVIKDQMTELEMNLLGNAPNQTQAAADNDHIYTQGQEANQMQLQNIKVANVPRDALLTAGTANDADANGNSASGNQVGILPHSVSEKSEIAGFIF